MAKGRGKITETWNKATRDGALHSYLFLDDGTVLRLQQDKATEVLLTEGMGMQQLKDYLTVIGYKKEDR